MNYENMARDVEAQAEGTTQKAKISRRKVREEDVSLNAQMEKLPVLHGELTELLKHMEAVRQRDLKSIYEELDKRVVWRGTWRSGEV